MFAAAATRLRTLTWLLPLKTMPLRLISITVPSPLIWPWIWLAGHSVVDPVEHRPVGLLGEINGGVAADVEGFPVEDCLVGGLLDLHRGLAVGLGLLRALGVLPTLGQAVIDFQTALAQTVRYKLYRAQRSSASGRLRRLLRGNRGDGVVQGLDRTLQLRIGFLLLGQWRCHPRQSANARTRRCGLLRRTFGSKPARAERRLRLRAARHQTQRHCVRQRLEQPQRRLDGFTLGGQNVGTTGWASEHHYEILFDCHTWVAKAAGLQKPAVTT
jgi:hypothetical protein